MVANKSLLSDDEINKLIRYAQEPQSQPASYLLSGQVWAEEKLEYMTFPIRSWRLTPVLKHPTIYTPGVRTSRNSDDPFDAGSVALWKAYLDTPDGSDALALPELGNDLLIRYLGVPALPNAVTCYYVEDVWARKKIHDLLSRLYDANRRKKTRVMVAPLLKAAILQSVKYF